MISLPSLFEPTHPTAGLDGYPARDFFGQPRELVRVLFWGRVVRISGKPPSDGGVPGGAYGRSVYIKNMNNGHTRFITHMDELCVEVGENVSPRRVIGTVCDSNVSGRTGTTHVHMGLNRGG